MSVIVISFLITGLVWLASVFLLYRISTFRVDRPWHRGYFGPPIFGLGFPEYLRRANYTEDGQRFYPWLVVTWVASSVLFILSFVLFARFQLST